MWLYHHQPITECVNTPPPLSSATRTTLTATSTKSPLRGRPRLAQPRESATHPCQHWVLPWALPRAFLDSGVHWGLFLLVDSRVSQHIKCFCPLLQGQQLLQTPTFPTCNQTGVTWKSTSTVAKQTWLQFQNLPAAFLPSALFIFLSLSWKKALHSYQK